MPPLSLSGSSLSSLPSLSFPSGSLASSSRTCCPHPNTIHQRSFSGTSGPCLRFPATIAAFSCLSLRGACLHPVSFTTFGKNIHFLHHPRNPCWLACKSGIVAETGPGAAHGQVGRQERKLQDQDEKEGKEGQERSLLLLALNLPPDCCPLGVGQEAGQQP